jgi:hypothetical protein
MSDSDLIRYIAAITQGHIMQELGLITEREFQLFEEKMRQKYNLSESSIFRDNRLLYKPQ